MEQETLKKNAAERALDFIKPGMVLGVGSGSTVNYFIDALPRVKGKIEAAVASSEATKNKLKAIGIMLTDLNSVSELPLYVDGADEINASKQMLKGEGVLSLGKKLLLLWLSNLFVLLIKLKKWIYLALFLLRLK